jgi:hypothetical protein
MDSIETNDIINNWTISAPGGAVVKSGHAGIAI